MPGFAKILEHVDDPKSVLLEIKRVLKKDGFVEEIDRGIHGKFLARRKWKIPKNVLPLEQEPKEGRILIMSTLDGKNFPVKIEPGILYLFNHNNTFAGTKRTVLYIHKIIRKTN